VHSNMHKSITSHASKKQTFFCFKKITSTTRKRVPFVSFSSSVLFIYTGSDLFVDKMMNESAGICDVMITEARQPNSRSRKLKMRRKLKMSFEKYKDMRVCEDEDSVFSDVPEDEDLSEIDEDWLNAEIVSTQRQKAVMTSSVCRIPTAVASQDLMIR